MKIIITVAAIFILISCDKTEIVYFDTDEHVIDNEYDFQENDEIADNYIDSDTNTDADTILCKGNSVDASTNGLSFLGPASQTITISGDCGSTVTITCSIGITSGMNMCICVCTIDSISWGDNGSGENVYNSIYVFSGTNGNNTYVDQWTPSTIEKNIQLESGICQVGHSIYTARLYFILRIEQGRHADLPLQWDQNVGVDPCVNNSFDNI
ncbi:MAG TPA: hypothetical protein VLJ60_06185 [bacterium]|nr:hypothetical protein [bacterium]